MFWTWLFSFLKNIFENFIFLQAIIQNAALSGGVAIGSTADLMIQPYAALLIGFSAGAITVIGFLYINVGCFLKNFVA